MAKTSSVHHTNSRMIDGVLSGYAWASDSVSYSFPVRASAYSYNNEPNHKFGAVSGTLRQMAKSVLDQDYGNSANDGFSVEGLTNLTINVDTASSADIRLARSSEANPTAYAYLPSNGSRGGDIWFGSKYNYSHPEPGNYAGMTVIHELGHALGLKHGHERDHGFAPIPAKWNSLEFTAMTYNTFIGDKGDYYKAEKNGYPQTFMMADIAALQHMYGADFSTNSDDTVYTWKPASGKTFVNGEIAINPNGNRIFATLWDGGGHDTYDLSAYGSNLKIDLRPGSFSVFKGSQLADLNGGPNHGHARGNIFNALQYQDDERSLIENARGGSGNDKLTGNTASNTLTGNGGADTLYGLSGNDILTGGEGRDTFIFAAHHGIDVITDFMNDYDYLKFIDMDIVFATKEEILACAGQIAADVVFTFGDSDVLTLKNQTLAQITAADILLG